jgi:hypothetical protein
MADLKVRADVHTQSLRAKPRISPTHSRRRHDAPAGPSERTDNKSPARPLTIAAFVPTFFLVVDIVHDEKCEEVMSRTVAVLLCAFSLAACSEATNRPPQDPSSTTSVTSGSQPSHGGTAKPDPDEEREDTGGSLRN